MNDKTAKTDHPIQQLLADRWSPYAFDSRPVAKSDLVSLFEAARWSASSYNEQPWSYIVASSDNRSEHERLLSCLVEPNQAWAKAAPVLALGVINLKFSRDGSENRVAAHDLGLASGNLVMEATARGLHVHQMAGIQQDKAREVYGIPANSVAWTGLAIGYLGDSSKLPDAFKQRDEAKRPRKALKEFVFTGKWGQSSALIA